MGNRAEVPEKETERSRLVEWQKERCWNLEAALVLEMSVCKLNTCVILSIQINRTNKTVTLRGWALNSLFNLVP
jgi:hypothetical protein